MSQEKYLPNYVSGSVKRLRKRLSTDPGNVSNYKKELLTAINTGVGDFIERLNRGEVKITTVSDFERLAKLGLLVHGEATEKIEHTTDIEEVTSEQFNELKEMPEFETIKAQLALMMNAKNEEA